MRERGGKKKGDRKGEGVEHSRGGGNVCGSGERDKLRQKEGERQGIREQSERDGKRQRERASANQAASLSPGLITVRRLRLFITRPRQTPRLLFR